MLRSLLAALALVCVATVAEPHDIYTGMRSKTGTPCCGVDDCVPYLGGYEQTKNGWRLDDGSLVPDGDVTISPDGRAHVCRWGGRIRCLALPFTF